MTRLRSRLVQEEQSDSIGGPTSYKIGPNQSKLLCAFCNGVYYVDEVTFRQVISALEEGGDNPFCCDECEAEKEELSH